MSLYNATISISKFTGDENNKAYTTLATNIRAMIRPASTEILALYPDLPVGQSFNYLIQGEDLVIPPESILTILSSDGEFQNGDQFVTKGEALRQRLMSNFVIKGVCVITK